MFIIEKSPKERQLRQEVALFADRLGFVLCMKIPYQLPAAVQVLDVFSNVTITLHWGLEPDEKNNPTKGKLSV